jgi:hypothetical protein
MNWEHDRLASAQQCKKIQLYSSINLYAKLSSLIIFKMKNIPQGNFPPGVIIQTNQTGRMNENEILYWIEMFGLNVKDYPIRSHYWF